MKCIYKTTNLVNNKTYIGQYTSSTTGFIWYLGSGLNIRKAVKKYGKENFKKEVLIEGDFSQELLDELERHYIRLYSPPQSKSSYNIEDGGKRGPIPSKIKKVLQYDIEGNFIKSWSGGLQEILEAFPKYKYTTMTGACGKETLTAYGFIWSYTKDQIKEKLKKINPDSRLYNKYTVLQYSAEGEFIKKWKSPIKASKALNIPYSALMGALTRKTVTASSLWLKEGECIKNVLSQLKIRKLENNKKVASLIIWVYKNNKWFRCIGSGEALRVSGLNINQASLIAAIKSKYGYRIYKNIIFSSKKLKNLPIENIDPRRKKVNQLDMNRNIIRLFSSKKEAAEYLGISIKTFSKKIRSGNMFFKGHVWELTDATITV